MTPKFTLIVPSYNGGSYLKQCLAAIEAQTYTNYTLAVLDDGSTDGTLEWLREMDSPRLTLYPAPGHLGIVKNWQRASQIPRAEFMTIIGQDDLLDPEYLAVMDTLTRQHPDAGLYHAHFRFINERGETLRDCRPLPARETAADYLSDLFSDRRDTYGTGYVMRSARYDAVGGIPAFEKLLFADDALWMALIDGSYKATAPQTCFSCRLHSASTSGGTGWQSWAAALPLYAAFLKTLAARDQSFAEAFRAHAPAYFENWGRLLYTLALTRATRENQRVASGTRASIARALAQAAPSLPSGFDASQNFAAGPAMRAREWINRHRAARAAYNLYVRGRYG